MKNTKKLEITLLLASMLTMLANAIIAPSLPAITEAFKYVENVEALTKLMLTLPALTIAIISPMAGRIIDKYGRIKVLLISLIIYLLAGTSGYWLNSIYGILIGRVILGFGVSGIMTAATTLVGDYFTGKKREQFMGVQGAFSALGGLLFIPTAGYLSDINWRFAFLVYGFAALVIVLVPFSLYEPKKKDNLDQQNEATVTVGNKVWFVYISSFLTMLFFYIIPVQLPYLLQKFEGVKANHIGLAIGSMMISIAISAVLSKNIRQRFSYLSMYIIGFILMAIGYTIIGFSPSYAIAVVGVVVVGLGIGSLIPNSNLWMMSLVSIAHRGAYVGKLTRANFLGMFLSPLAIQPIQNMVGLQSSFLVVSGILLCTALIFGLVIAPQYDKLTK